jgi:hypothetical protein
MTFPRRRGYDGAAVWNAQSVIADLLDAGRSPAAYLSQKTLPPGYGFDMEAVDRYLDGLVGKSDMGVALLQGLAELGRCGLAGHEGESSLTVSGRSEEMPDGFADRRIAAA